ncbi:MAG: DUF1194 domain-containing protein [Rhizobiaceae bacterium]
MGRCSRTIAAFLCGWLQVIAASAARAEDQVDLELVIAVDISRSMDFEELIIQRKGYATAFASKDVIDAILGGLNGRIAVTYLEWAANALTRVLVPWTVLASREDALNFAEILSRTNVDRQSRTSISGAMSAARDLFAISSLSSMRQVIDISGDGPNNQWRRVDEMRDEILADGITINGLPLIVRPTDNGFGIANLDEYYEDCVIGGPGSFVLAVRSWEEFPAAVRRKLVLEITGLQPTGHQVRAIPVSTLERAKVDCLIGEKLWRERMRDMEWR